MNEYEKYHSQWRHSDVKVVYFARFSIFLLKMTSFLDVFNPVSIEQSRWQMLYFVSVY